MLYSMNTQQLHKKIMRRVYYAFAIRLTTHPITAHVVILAIAAYALAALVHVDMVLRNIAATPVGELGTKLVSIVSQADAVTLLVLGVAIFAALSMPLRVPKMPRLGRMQAV